MQTGPFADYQQTQDDPILANDVTQVRLILAINRGCRSRQSGDGLSLFAEATFSKSLVIIDI
jgi:hypothetical protein